MKFCTIGEIFGEPHQMRFPHPGIIVEGNILALGKIC